MASFPTVHPLAAAFPKMSEADFDALLDDVRANGVREAGMLLEGRILDGRHRGRAAEACGRAMEWKNFEDLADVWPGLTPLDYVLSLNLHRRHLNEAQRALIAARLVETKQGERTDLAAMPAKSQSVMADRCHVSRDSVSQAAVILEKGAKQLVAEVEAGGMSLRSAKMVVELPAEEQAAMVAASPKIREAAIKELRGESRKKRRNSRMDAIRLASAPKPGLEGERRYPVLYADPPWQFRSGMSERSIENHYPTMTIDEIRALPVGDVATDPAVLFLWSTSPNLAEAFTVISAWGFTYKASAVWDKEIAGTGYWFRVRHELLLIATRGDFPAPAEELRPPSLYRERKAAHSVKPEAVRIDIEQMLPDMPRLELFSRAGGDVPKGWDVWGNQS